MVNLGMALKKNARRYETVDGSDSKEGTVANETKMNRRSWNWAELLVMSSREREGQKTLILDKFTKEKLK